MASEPTSAAEFLIVFGDNPERIRSEAAFAKLCGACPIPASSGQTSRHRLLRRRAPTSQRGALPNSHRTNAPPAHHRLRRSPHHRRPHQKRTSSAASNVSWPARSTNAS
ncbi:MAG: transposase [bacterium]|nr:transposase [bacterium]MDE0352554.1 transposase [bacterium]